MGIIQTEAPILVVDDTPQNIDILVESLGDLYSLMVATNGQEALEAVEEEIPSLILLDIMMPGMDGFEVCQKLKANDKVKDIPVIFLTAVTDVASKTKGFALGAVDYITKPFDIKEVTVRVETHLAAKMAREAAKDQNLILEEMVRLKTREIQNAQDVTIRMAASLAETRDNETGNHIIRTQRYVKLLAEEAARTTYAKELGQQEIDLLTKSAPLHDIGKVGIPDAILLKPGKLTEDEFAEMKRHTDYGREALLRAEAEIKGDSFLKFAREIAYTHHEKWNGFGYPLGLKEEGIPLSGRLMSIADVYDALISKRVYKPPFSHSKACAIIEGDAGTAFDPKLVECFISIKDTFRDVAMELCESEEVREALRQ